MGSYIYKVSVKRTINAANAPAPIHVSTYAYKPYGRSEEDDRLASLSGANRASKDWAKVEGNAPVYVVHGYSTLGNNPSTTEPNAVICLKHGCHGLIWDGAYDDDKLIVGHVAKVRGRWVYTPKA